MSSKTINVNPELLSMSKTRRSGSNKTKKSRPTPLISPNIMKRNLLQKIKQHKERNINSNNNFENEDIGKFSSDFQDSMKYLKDLTNNPGNYRNQRNQLANQFKPSQNILQNTHNKSLKNPYNNSNNYTNNIPTPNYNIAPVDIDYPEDNPNQYNQNNHYIQPPIQETQYGQLPEPRTSNKMNIPDIPYGCLKNGLKPTYRNWLKKTQKLSSISNKNILPPNEEQLDKIKTQISNNKINTDYNRGIIKKPKNKYLIKRTKRKKYKLGKSKHNRTISVLVKGNTLRKKVIQEKIGLHNKDIQDVKNYLKKHGLLKAGSSCPEDVLRKMYESAILSGYVKNKNKDVLLHNFLND